MLGRAKAAMNAKGTSNSIELSFSNNTEHITIMPDVSDDGRTGPQVFINPAYVSKNLHRAAGGVETVHDCLPPENTVPHRPPVSISKHIFEQ